MKNRYFGLRHGESAANVEGIVVSDPAVGTIRYGLTARGREQAANAVQDRCGLGPDTRIYCSDFFRARETADLVAASLGCKPPVSDARLRERFFGQWDMKGNSDYETVWALDAENAEQSYGGAESARSVCVRMGAFIASIEEAFEDETILIISHGDPLQLLQTVFEGRSASEHRQLRHWETAELRRLL